MAKILIIEDKKGIRRALAALLTNLNHEVTEAEDGQDAIDLLRQTRFDLILTEVLLQSVDATEVMAWLETQPDRPPVIAMSGGNSQIPAEMALLLAKTQANATIEKPIDEARLLRLVESLLQPSLA